MEVDGRTNEKSDDAGRRSFQAMNTPYPIVLRVDTEKLSGFVWTATASEEESAIHTPGTVVPGPLAGRAWWTKIPVLTFKNIYLHPSQPREDKGDREGIPHTHPIP